MTKIPFKLALLTVAALLTAWGGGDDTPIVVATPAAPARGSLVDAAAVVTTLTAAQSDANASGLRGISGAAKCDVKVVALNDVTLGVNNEAANASGVILVPGGTGADCTAPAGLDTYARGTEVLKTRALANPADSETFLLAAMYTSQGYAVVAADDLGFAKSIYSHHPYLHADSEASAVLIPSVPHHRAGQRR